MEELPSLAVVAKRLDDPGGMNPFHDGVDENVIIYLKENIASGASVDFLKRRLEGSTCGGGVPAQEVTLRQRLGEYLFAPSQEEASSSSIMRAKISKRKLEPISSPSSPLATATGHLRIKITGNSGGKALCKEVVESLNALTLSRHGGYWSCDDKHVDVYIYVEDVNAMKAILKTIESLVAEDWKLAQLKRPSDLAHVPTGYKPVPKKWNF
jgi:hypothetical protein